MKKKLLVGAGVALAILLAVLPFAVYQAGRHVRGQYFDSAGVQIYYTDEGVGVPVILVHGYSANADLNWRLPGIVRRLRKHFRVITLDVRGHGLSGKPHDPSEYGIEMVKDVHRLMDHLQIPEAHLVGYSMGGFITFKFTAMYPERLISAMPCGAAWMTPSDPLHTLLLGIYQRMVGEHSPARSTRSLVNSLERGALRAVLDMEAQRCVAEGFSELAVSEEELRAVSMPVMTIRGGDDAVGRGGGDIKTVLSDSRETTIPGKGHTSVLFSSKFHEAMVAFLLEHSPQ